MRADAQRNYDRLVRAAISAFTADGTGVPLEDIAASAGVGVGTLYRHFPTRADLIAAAAATWEADIDGAVGVFLARRGEAVHILSDWFFALIALMRLQRGYAGRLTAAIDRADSPMQRKSELLVSANQRVMNSIMGESISRRSSVIVSRLVGSVAVHADAADLPDDQVRELLDVISRGVMASAGRP